MSKKPNLTDADKDALYVMPDGWFRATDLPYPRVTRAEYRCERLKKEGYLEWRVVGCLPNFESQYRKREGVNEALKGYIPINTGGPEFPKTTEPIEQIDVVHRVFGPGPTV
jgi:hypothetical protein